MNTFWDIFQLAGGMACLAGSLFFVAYLGVFLPGPLRTAPTRESNLSLPIAGAVIVFYFMLAAGVTIAAVAVGAVPKSYLKSEPAAATQPAPPSVPGTASAPASTTSATVPATTMADSPAPRMSKADRDVYDNAIALVMMPPFVIAILVSLAFLFKERLSGWGLHPRQLPKGVLKGLAAFLIVYPLIMAFAMGLDWVYQLFFQHTMSEHTTFQTMDQHVSLARQIILCLGAIVVAPVTEELFFRGILQTTLIQYGWGVFIPQFMRPGILPAVYRPSPAGTRWAAIVLAALAFALLHQIDQAPIIFVLALALGYVYERTGTLWAPIALHMAFNAANIATYLSGQG